MANDKKFIVKNGLRADNIEFTDSQSGTNQITLSMLNSDTLNFEGDAGSLFSIADDLTGSVFTVGDVSGIPIVDINGDTHNITMAQFDGKVMIGGTDSGSTDSDVLNVTGNVKATAFIGDGSNLTGISGGLDSAGVKTVQEVFLVTDSGQNTGIGKEVFKKLGIPSGVQVVQNTAYGSKAGSHLTTGGYNTFIGQEAGFKSSVSANTGSENTFVGAFAGHPTTGAFNNVALGYAALGGSNGNGARIVAIGHGAMGAGYASNNVAIGYQALYFNEGGDAGSNVGIGNQALFTSTGSSNVAIGSYRSGYSMTTGDKNVIIGRYDGNMNGLDIRTSDRNIVLSDGDGNIRLHIDSVGVASFKSDVTLDSDLTVSGALQVSGGINAVQSINAQTGTTYTTVLADGGKLVTLSNGSAITLTIPPNSSVAYPVGTKIDFIQIGAGQVTVAGGAGVTVNSTPTLKFRAQHSGASCIKIATDTWQLVGDLAES